MLVIPREVTLLLHRRKILLKKNLHLLINNLMNKIDFLKLRSRKKEVRKKLDVNIISA
jgi:hypothetical protein